MLRTTLPSRTDWRNARLVVEAEAEFQRGAPDEFLAREARHRDEGVVHVHEALRLERLDRLRDGAVLESLRKALLGQRVFRIGPLEVAMSARRPSTQVRRAASSACRVTSHFFVSACASCRTSDVVERLLQQHEIVADAEPLRHRLPRVVRERRADDDLQRGIVLPEPLDGLDAVPARRHPHIHERQRVRLARQRSPAALSPAPPGLGMRNRS